MLISGPVMPAKPAWYGDLDRIVKELERLPRPWVDRYTVELLLGVGSRRAQQILAPCITEKVGTSGLADRDLVIQHLRRLAKGGDVDYERRRRRKVASAIEEVRTAWLDGSRLLVEAPPAVVTQRIEGLPPGVTLEPGQITVRFSTAREALEKLLAIAMAAGNEYDRFAGIIEPDGSG